MKTLIESSKEGKNTPLLKKLARLEGVLPRVLRRNIADGKAVIPKNKLRTIKKPCAIGRGLKTKVNANIGTSEDRVDIRFELRKLKIAEDSGADTVMDLSTGGDLKKVRMKILEKTNVPLGTVPLYEIAIMGLRKFGSISKIPESFFLKALENQAKEGIDFFTIHSGVTKKTVRSLKKSGRIMGIVSRGGAILMEWILKTGKENPLYTHFDEILDLAHEYDITLSLGDGMRPGAIIDATDDPQIDELVILGALQKKAKRKGVQVIIEGPGHVPLNQIKANVELEKKICNGAPFYVLGPIVTDVAPGYDHITSAMGGAIAAASGADFLCYVTPAEHLRLPTIEDVKDGVIATRIAAHAGDIAKSIPGAVEEDIKISKARAQRNWKKQFSLSIDPERCRVYRRSSKPQDKDVCTMCSEYCSLKISEKYLKGKRL